MYNYSAGAPGTFGSDGVNMGQYGTGIQPPPPTGIPGTSPAPGYSYDESGNLISLAEERILRPQTPARPPAPLAPQPAPGRKIPLPMIAVAGIVVAGLGWWFVKGK